MSRTDKDEPSWVQGSYLRNSDSPFAWENHADNCEHEYQKPYMRRREREVYKGEWELMKCYKFTDSLGNVFWAPERERFAEGSYVKGASHLSKKYVFNDEDHPNAVQKMDALGMPIAARRWYQPEMVRYVRKPLGDFVPCSIDEPGGECKRYYYASSRCCLSCSWCYGSGNNIERHSTKQRLNELKYDYNSGYDVDDEESSFVSTRMYSKDPHWYC